jgi:hypothetical protein
MVKYKFYKSTRKNKKYKVEIYEKGSKIKTVHFGGVRKNGIPYSQFKDTTPLKLFSKYNHGDKKRKARYFKRHGKAIKHSAKYFSHKYLW